MGKRKDNGKDQQEKERQRILREALGFVLSPKEADAACAGLLEAFGSFDGLFAAPEEILAKTPGMKPEAVRFLRLVVQVSQAYLEERSWNLQRVFDTPSAVELFRPKFLGRKNEAVCLMLLDGRGRVVYNDIVCEGSVTQVPLYLRKILNLCIEYHVDDLFLAHNHPSGTALPSRNDLVVTNRLITVMDSIGANLEDHVILAGDSYYSFRDSGALQQQRSLVRETQARELEATLRMEERLENGGRA